MSIVTTGSIYLPRPDTKKKKEKPLVVYDEQKLKFGQRKIPGY